MTKRWLLFGGGALVVSACTTEAQHSAADGPPTPARCLETPLPSAELPDAAPVRFLALGDSYTIGESVPPEERFPVQLAAALRSEGADIGQPLVIARTGWTTDELDAGIDAALPEGPFAMVSLLIGVNNQYRNRSLDEYREQFRSLLERSVGFAGGDETHVVVVSIPDYGATPFGASDAETIGREIDAFNDVAREEAGASGARFVDVTPLSRLAREDPSLVAADGLHPSGAQYAGWACLALPAARAVVGLR